MAVVVSVALTSFPSPVPHSQQYKERKVHAKVKEERQKYDGRKGGKKKDR